MWYVYVDYTREEIPRAFYVGKGNLARVKRSIRNQHHSRIAAKYGVDRRIAFETPDESLALLTEVKLISELGTFSGQRGYNTLGCNYTAGGDGVSGLKHSVESNERNRIAHTGKTYGSEVCERKRKSMLACPTIRRRRVCQETIDGDLVKIHSSLCEAARFIDKPGSVGLLSRCCRGLTMTSYGYRWKFLDSAGNE